MTIRKLMQYEHGQDDLGSTMSLDEFRSNPFVKAIVGIKNVGPYVNLLASRGVSNTKLTYGINHDLKEEIRLHNALHRMEKKNPSVSRIRDEAQVSYDRGVIVGRDFETNQPVYRENRELVSNPNLKGTLDYQLGFAIGQEPVRALWSGQEVQGVLDEAFPVGRCFGVRVQ